MKKVIKKGLVISLLNIIIGGLIAGIVCLIIQRTQNHFELDPNVNLSWTSILNNNIKFILIYSIPIFGFISYILGFSFIYVLIGVSISSMGLGYTLQKLIHLPLEVFALSLPLLIFNSNKIQINQRLKLVLISSFSLLLSAFIESTL